MLLLESIQQYAVVRKLTIISKLKIFLFNKYFEKVEIKRKTQK